MQPGDPMEEMMRAALRRSGIEFTEDSDPRNKALDFFLPEYGVHIEVKQFHSYRISDQMSRAPNVIAVQGKIAVEFFAALLLLKESRKDTTNA